MQVEGPKRRISWIDVAKGLGIIFIVIGHSLKTGWLREYLYSFHVPFFFFLSGITYRYKEEKKNFWNKKIKSIVVPYLVFGLISILIYRVLGEFASDKLGSEISSTRILPNLIGLIYGNSKTGYMRWNLPLWFLTCLITTTLIVDVCETFIINNVKRGRNLYRILIAGCLVVLNYILTQFFHVVLPWHMETACGMSLFFWLGIIDGENHFVQKMVLAIGRNKSMVTAITLIFVGVIVTFFNRGASIREDNYHFYPLYLINAILAGGGIHYFVSISKQIELWSF